MKGIKHILTGIIWTLASVYILIIVLLHIPAIQSFIASKVEVALKDKFNTEFEIGRVDLGFLSRLTIDDITMYDQAGQPMIKASRLSIKVDYTPLMKGKVSISSAQIFGIDGRLYKENSASIPNYQFALDALASKDSTKNTPLDICVNSLIIRNGCIKYNQNDIKTSPGRFNTKHISIKDISAHIIMPYLTDDSLKLQIKKLSMKEESGIDLRNLSFRLTANKNKSTLSDFNIRMPNTELNLGNTEVSYTIEDKQLKTESIRFSSNIYNSHVNMLDIACIEPALKYFTEPLNISADISGNGNKLYVDNFHLYTPSNKLNIMANANAIKIDNSIKWSTFINEVFIGKEITWIVSDNMKNDGKKFPEIITRLGNVHFSGNANGKGKDIAFRGKINTGLGETVLDLGITDNTFRGKINTEGINIGELLDNKKLGLIAGNIITNGSFNNKNISYAKAKVEISQFGFNSYTYKNISADGVLKNNIIDGTLNMNDPNGGLNINGELNIQQKEPSIKLQAYIDKINPKAMKLNNKWGDAVFSANINADITGNDINKANGWLEIKDFSMMSPESVYSLDEIKITSNNTPDGHLMTLNSDFADIMIEGTYNYSTITQSIINIIGSKIPTLPGLPAVNEICDNNFRLEANFYKSDWARKLLNLPLDINSPVYVVANLNDDTRSLNLIASALNFSYNDSDYNNGMLILSSTNSSATLYEDTLVMNLSINKVMNNGHELNISAKAGAANNSLATSISWDNNQKKSLKGIFNSTAYFYMSEQGSPAAHIQIHPSEILVNDTIWDISQSQIIYDNKRIEVDSFAIKHNRQHMILSGFVTDNTTDSLVADLQDVDISYILDIVNFHSVEFEGLASGKACIKSVFGTPEAYANLEVKDFKFQEGRMGTLTADVKWDNEEKQIDINACANDSLSSATTIKGYISPSKNYLDLDIGAQNTNIEFLKSFCGSFMDNIDAYANGNVRLAGDLSKLNLTGLLVADGQLDITTLNTTYRLVNDTIRLEPNEIIFDNVPIYDIYGNMGIVSGQLHHKNLKRLTFDLNVEADHLLSYDFKDYGNSTFYGTVYATGNCKIRGRSGRIDFNINAKPERGSFIEYNAASPDAISDHKFIEWRDVTQYNDSIVNAIQRSIETQIDIPSDIHITFIINATPDFTLRVLMDQKSGDYISLNGSGVLRANYYNKGNFTMYGNYLIESGMYKLTIQNIMNRNFQFEQGGTIVFQGDPYNAILDLNALYTINSVPLSDLQIGKSFTSNNIRVDCIMKISGTPHSPQVAFDIDLPSMNSDAKQMVKSLINSEEEMVQQVIYLLSIGRFYAASSNNVMDDGEQLSQTTLAMQSLLSGTISRQISKVLSSVVNNKHLDFGANISTGDEGWNNAEYEGLVSANFFNNRLLINGQFGYRDNKNATTSFIGEFDIRYLLFANGNLAFRMYNQANDRYFTKSTLNTQGLGIIIKRDFNSWRDLFGINNRRKKVKNNKN